MPQLFFTDLSALHRSVTIDGVAHELSTEEIAATDNIGLVEGMPFTMRSVCHQPQARRREVQERHRICQQRRGKQAARAAERWYDAFTHHVFG
ncbi:hypothetical protein I6F26_29865 [Ensifer sp. IC3342]|nr:hypothetical protein [Ensifer sp. BRP08]MCA1450737.1 hypothetical protein [Ensifer sp. IC3342]